MKKAAEIIDEISNYPRFPSEDRLDVIRGVLKKLKNPEMSTKFVHVVGTNGKGSTCSLIASVLEESNFKVGLFTSPHLYDWKERIQINGEVIPNDVLERLFPQIEHYDLGIFEAWFLLGLLYFREQEVDIAILEAGIGGRMDTTNVIPSPEVAVLTNVGFDHQDILGETLEEIMLDKAAVQKEAVLVTGIEEPNLRALLPEHRYAFAERDFCEKNKALAREALKVLKERGWEIHESNIESGFEKHRWPLRMEVLSEEPLIIADGAHNLQGAQALKAALSQKSQGRRILLLGISSDKNYHQLAPLFAEGMDEVIVSQASYRGVPAQELADLIPGAIAFPLYSEATYYALSELKKEDELYILGSLYFVAEVAQLVVKSLSNDDHVTYEP